MDITCCRNEREFLLTYTQCTVNRCSITEDLLMIIGYGYSQNAPYHFAQYIPLKEYNNSQLTSEYLVLYCFVGHQWYSITIVTTTRPISVHVMQCRKNLKVENDLYKDGHSDYKIKQVRLLPITSALAYMNKQAFKGALYSYRKSWLNTVCFNYYSHLINL